ncbi:MAG: hypothetical protein KGM16_16845 [Bacteroidota bacterium]|nr:hypothetical protein [Bacteroidota bacterium]
MFYFPGGQFHRLDLFTILFGGKYLFPLFRLAYREKRQYLLSGGFVLWQYFYRQLIQSYDADNCNQ